MLTFSSRTAKEILRDPVNLGFGLGFPVVLILLLSAIQANVPVSVFQIDSLAPGMTVFGLSFMTLFAATLIAKDRESALLQRLYTTPLTAADFIFGYTLPLLPFCHAVRVEQAAYAGSFADIGPDLSWVIAYAAAAVIFAVLAFLHQMKRQ